MKKLFSLFAVLACGAFISVHAQSADAPKMAAYSVNDSVATANNVHTGKAVLAPFAVDSVASSVQGPVPVMMAEKKDDPIITPKKP